jgi:dolichol-phosphate mannosyltransferase
MKKITVVIPVWNEEESIERLIERLRVVLPRVDVAWEFCFVDDGSRDQTIATLRKHAGVLGSWRIVKLSRNFGQQSAYRAGLDAAEGDAVVFLDADLQDPPELIPEMIRLWESGAKLITACRKSRSESGLRRTLFDLFHHLFHLVTSGAMPKNSGTFALMDRAVVDQVKAMPELNMFLPAMRCWVGFRQDVVWYDRASREGDPKQSMGKLLGYAWDGITSFSTLPLKAISVMGLLISFFGFAYAAGLVCVKILQAFGFFQQLVVQGFTTLAVAVLCLGGVQLTCLGVIGEYVAKVYREVKRRPPYVVETVLNSSDQ